MSFEDDDAGYGNDGNYGNDGEDNGGGEEYFEDEFGGVEEERMYEQEGDEEDQGIGGDEEGEEDFVGEEYMGGESPGGEVEFKETFADLQRTAGGAIGAGVSGIKKSRRSAQDAAQDKARGVLNDDMYDWVKEDDKRKVYNKMAKMSNIERYNVETLIPAILFQIQGYSLDKNFNSFYKKLTDINKLDLIRYIRGLEV